MATNFLKYPLRMGGSLTVLFVAMTLLFSACKNDDDNGGVPAPQTITDLVTSGSQFNLLEAAVVRANLATTLSGTGPFTVFAPTDDAFRAAGFADAAAINAAPVATLSNILLYHVVSGSAVASSAIPSGQTAYPTSVSGNAAIHVTKASSGSVSINNARLTVADGIASNGVVHVIDRVLLPPAGNILQVAQSDTTLSFVTAAAGRGGAAVTTALGGTTPLTVFAPTNAAFRATPFNSLSAINAAPVATLTAILTNHVLAASRAYSPTLTSGPVATFGGGSLTVTVGSNNAISILSRGNGTNASNVIANSGTTVNQDINATNGVIHKIDRVLLP